MNRRVLYAYVGNLGSGKFFQMSKKVEELSTNGNGCLLLSFADPIKKILKDSFGLTKQGKTKSSKSTKINVKYQVVDKVYKLIKNLNLPEFKDLSELKIKEKISANYDSYDFYKYVHRAQTTTDEIEYNNAYRRCAQLLGTELARSVCPSIWVDTLIRKARLAFGTLICDYVFVDDLRFINEYEALMEAKRTNNSFDIKIVGVTATPETRAQRRGMTVEQIIYQENHASEKEIDDILVSIPIQDIIVND